MNSYTPSSQVAPPSGRILATVLQDYHGYGGKDDCITVIRCNGSLFYVDLSPFFVCNSPLLLARYLDFVSVVRDDYSWNDDINDPDDPTHKHPEDILRDFHAWLIAALQPLLLRLVPNLPPSFDPAKLATGSAHPLLSEYLFPDQHYCHLEADAESPIPIHLPDEEDTWTVTPLNPIPLALAHVLRAQHVPFLDASTIEVSFRDPSHALDHQPTRVLAPLNPSGPKTPCFLKTFGTGGWTLLENELLAHLRILKSPLPPTAHVIRLLGVVTAERGEVAGILLTYVHTRRENWGVLEEYFVQAAPRELRKRWAAQVSEAVEQMHEAGLVWGGARGEHIMVDGEGDAWLIGMGGGVGEGDGGTREGDLEGVAEILRMLDEELYEPFDEEEWDVEIVG
ncbi:hypothetical protein C8A05DRAFT_19154 [Staphylotrichum tortipilum]|uniref:Protein kinase domain-containing protein n=1 Tax=Staphylotrichum tortipilum TaxID=2831512 RepID=A0AAN6MDU4_9PEZI|nr:hypothetical protein C8A05DRAFT_19154 [Staphylotrichum longicolle]